MRLVVETREGTVVVDDLSTDASICDLTTNVLSSLQHGQGVIDPSQHVLVCNGRRMKDMSRSLRKQGINDRSSLVLLKKRALSLSMETELPVVPTLENIETVVRAEAERQGREILSPTVQSVRARDSEPFETRLHDIMQALQNMSSAADLHNGDIHNQVTLALRQASRMPREDMGSLRSGVAEEVVVPAPNSTSMERLQEMGFSRAAARRALLLTRNAVVAAANYLIAHMEDSDIEAEPTMQELREVYQARNVRLAEPRQVEASEEHMQILLEMGFTDAGSRHALVRHDNNLDAAINLLTARPMGWEPVPEEAAPSSGTGEPGQRVEGAEEDPPVEGHDASGMSTEQRQAAGISAGSLSEPVNGLDGITGGVSNMDEVGNGGDDATVEAAGSGELWMVHGSEQQEEQVGMGDLDEIVSIVGQVPEVPASEADDENNRQGEQLETQDSLFGNMMDIHEGMRGIITALSGVEGGRMSGALPILSTGSGESGHLDPLHRIVDDMRWGGSFPDLIGPLIDEEQTAGEESDQYEEGFITETTFTNASGQDDDENGDRDSQEESSGAEQEVEEYSTGNVLEFDANMPVWSPPGQAATGECEDGNHDRYLQEQAADATREAEADGDHSTVHGLFPISNASADCPNLLMRGPKAVSNQAQMGCMSQELHASTEHQGEVKFKISRTSVAGLDTPRVLQESKEPGNISSSSESHLTRSSSYPTQRVRLCHDSATHSSGGEMGTSRAVTYHASMDELPNTSRRDSELEAALNKIKKPLAVVTQQTSLVRYKNGKRYWRWKDVVARVLHICRGASADDYSLLLQTEHWLEACDHKHRYGSNLKPYFKAWLDSDTHQSFFKWLDEGEGRRLDVPERPRSKMDTEQVVYCGIERCFFEVTIDKGLFRYEISKCLVTTDSTVDAPPCPPNLGKKMDSIRQRTLQNSRRGLSPVPSAMDSKSTQRYHSVPRTSDLQPSPHHQGHTIRHASSEDQKTGFVAQGLAECPPEISATGAPAHPRNGYAQRRTHCPDCSLGLTDCADRAHLHPSSHHYNNGNPLLQSCKTNQQACSVTHEVHASSSRNHSLKLGGGAGTQHPPGLLSKELCKAAGHPYAQLGQEAGSHIKALIEGNTVTKSRASTGRNTGSVSLLHEPYLGSCDQRGAQKGSAEHIQGDIEKPRRDHDATSWHDEYSHWAFGNSSHPVQIQRQPGPPCYTEDRHSGGWLDVHGSLHMRKLGVNSLPSGLTHMPCYHLLTSQSREGPSEEDSESIVYGRSCGGSSDTSIGASPAHSPIRNTCCTPLGPTVQGCAPMLQRAATTGAPLPRGFPSMPRMGAHQELAEHLAPPTHTLYFPASELSTGQSGSEPSLCTHQPAVLPDALGAGRDGRGLGLPLRDMHLQQAARVTADDGGGFFPLRRVSDSDGDAFREERQRTLLQAGMHITTVSPRMCVSDVVMGKPATSRRIRSSVDSRVDVAHPRLVSNSAIPVNLKLLDIVETVAAPGSSLASVVRPMDGDIDEEEFGLCAGVGATTPGEGSHRTRDLADVLEERMERTGQLVKVKTQAQLEEMLPRAPKVLSRADSTTCVQPMLPRWSAEFSSKIVFEHGCPRPGGCVLHGWHPRLVKGDDDSYDDSYGTLRVPELISNAKKVSGSWDGVGEAQGGKAMASTPVGDYQTLQNGGEQHSNLKTNKEPIGGHEKGREKWIYVWDMHSRLYINRKLPGRFHHSSFVAGGAVKAAGSIVVENGVLKQLTTWSGHYRPRDSDIGLFLEWLQSKHVDLKRVELLLVKPHKKNSKMNRAVPPK